ncbi:MAG: methyltransferase domain-containing protein [Anaerolineales bacterium]|nr:methyltransferase domain-containing protein [Anaerolineales bacterium]
MPITISDLINRPPVPTPWADGDPFPWDDPDFSARMLAEHLTQEHDMASRKFNLIDRHVEFIHTRVLGGKSARILDLGCGPGLYASRLAQLGHRCVGIDFSPASIAYAQAHNPEGNTYIEADLRTAEFGEGYDLAMLIFGEFNVFPISEARTILEKAYQALRPGGALVLEPHTYAAVEQMGKETSSWFSAKTGLFSERPHVYLLENYWHAEEKVTSKRMYIIDAETSEVAFYSQGFQAYTNADYENLLTECGFADVAFYPSLAGGPAEGQVTLLAITARKAA